MLKIILFFILCFRLAFYELDKIWIAVCLLRKN